MHYKILVLTFIVVLINFSWSHAQSISHASISSGGGQLQEGNIRMSFSLGESFVAVKNNGLSISNGFWNVVINSNISAAITTYRFTGNGSFFDANNWDGMKIPPNPLPANAEIFIDPIAGGQCVLDQPYELSKGSKLNVVAGKHFSVEGNLIIFSK